MKSAVSISQAAFSSQHSAVSIQPALACLNLSNNPTGLIADCFFLSLNFQHTIKRHARPVLNIVFHFDLIDDITFRQIFQGPAQMLR